MNPESPAEQPTPVSAAAEPAPVPSVSPAPVMMGSNTPTAPAGISPTASPAKTGLIIGGIITAVVLLVAVAAAAWFLWFSPAAQASRASSAFMHAITTGDTDKAVTLSTAASDDDRAFIKSIAANVKGSYKRSGKTFTANKGYYLYTLSGAHDQYARTIVEKSNGKWLVSSFISDAKSLALIPAASKSETPVSDTVTNSGAQTCLVDADYDAFYLAIVGEAKPADITYGYNADSEYTDSVFFVADSLSFQYPDASPARLQHFADFYKQNAAKLFTFHLQGSVATTAAADLNFSNQRGQKIADVLKAAGVPASRIVIDDPINISSMTAPGTDYSDDFTKETARRVDITISPDKTCNPGSSASDGTR